MAASVEWVASADPYTVFKLHLVATLAPIVPPPVISQLIPFLNLANHTIITIAFDTTVPGTTVFNHHRLIIDDTDSGLPSRPFCDV